MGPPRAGNDRCMDKNARRIIPWGWGCVQQKACYTTFMSLLRFVGKNLRDFLRLSLDVLPVRILLIIISLGVFLMNMTSLLQSGYGDHALSMLYMLLIPLAIAALLWLTKRIRSLEWTFFFGAAGVFLIAAALVLPLPRNEPLFIQDGALIAEEAARGLLDGNNPYAASYTNGPAGQWDSGKVEFSFGDDVYRMDNPALDHYTYPPLTFLLPVPFVMLKDALPWLADFRILTALCMAIAVGVLARCFHNTHRWVPVLLTLLLLNPFSAIFTITGYNDAIVFIFMALTGLALHSRRWTLAGMAFGFALLTKQTALLFAPMLLGLWWYRSEKSFGRVLRVALPAIIVFSIVVLPFVLWDPPAFFEDVLLYPSGNAAISYPMVGYGFSVFLVSVMRYALTDTGFPFFIPQLLIGLPVFAALIIKRPCKPGTGWIILAGTLLSFTLMFFSRYFHSSHLGYLLDLVLLGYLFTLVERQETTVRQENI